MELRQCLEQWIINPLNLTTRIFDWLSPLSFLAIRIWLFKVFFFAGLTKIETWDTTLFLFEHEYDVPLLPSYFAAVSGTAAELILPILVLVGLGARLPAFALFMFNLVAVYAYRSFLYSDDGAAGLMQHILWGFMILSVMAHGYGKLSLDYLFSKKCDKYQY